MAEVFKEFVNKSITAADLNSDNQTITLFTNDTNKQAIVRGIDIASDAKITKDKAKLFIGNQPVLDSFESATGSLFVDSGQSLTLKLNNVLTSQTVETLNLSHQGYTSGTANSYKYKEYTYTIASSSGDFSPAGITPGLVAGNDYSSELTGIHGVLGSSYSGELWRNDDGNYWGWLMDTNSISYIIYSANGATWTNVDTTNYSGPAINASSKKIYRKSGQTLRSWDMTSTSTGGTDETGSLHSTNTSYQSADVISAGGDEYYWWGYSGQGHMDFVKKVGQSGSTYANLSTYTQNRSTGAKNVVAYNSDEEVFYYFLFTDRTWVSSTSGTSFGKIPLGLVNNLTGSGGINGQLTSGTDNNRWTLINHDHGISTVLGASPYNRSRTKSFKHLGGPYVSFPLSANQVRIAKCENNGLTTVEDVALDWQSNTGSSNDINMSFLTQRGSNTSATYTPSQLDLTTQLRIVGVEIS